MNLLVAGAVAASQLCYNASQDINAHHFMREAVILEQPLTLMIENKSSDCIPLLTASEKEEAVRIVKADATRKTLFVK